jgi:Na+/melibiose symporter-like transporter
MNLQLIIPDIQDSKTDALNDTSNIIVDHYRFKKLEGKFRIKSIFLISCLLAIFVVVIICMLQYDEYSAYVNQRYDYINQTEKHCNATKLSSIDIISTPIAAFLLILYIIIYKRRRFLKNKFKYRNIGIPMTVSVWNKV